MRINRKNDYAFKRIFGHEDTKDILADFLTDTLSTPVKPEEITLINTELSPDYLRGKLARLDIRIKRSAFHEKMNIEMQCDDEGNIGRRILFYWGKNYTEELNVGEDYASLARQINIVIVDFDIFHWENSEKFHSVFHVLEKDEPVMFSDALEIHVLELPKLKRRVFRRPAETCLSGLECWGLYLNNLGGEEMERIAERKPAIKRAMTIEDIFTKDEEERQMYELREKGRRDYANAINTAEKRGEERGRVEEKSEIARNLLKMGFPVDQIAIGTGLDEKDILALGQQEE